MRVIRLVEDRGKDAIDETARMITAIGFGEFDGFVNRSPGWYPIIQQYLRDGKSEDGFLDAGHLCEGAARGGGGELGVDLGQMLNDIGDEASGKIGDTRGDLGIGEFGEMLLGHQPL